MYICLDCGYIFTQPQHIVERHGLDTPPFEEYTGCPKCGGAYDYAYMCKYCEAIVPAENFDKVLAMCNRCISKLDEEDKHG